MFKFIVKFIFMTVLGVILIAGLIYVYFLFTPASSRTVPPLQDGDIIFQTSLDPQSKAVMLATYSLYSHMGIIKIAQSGEPVVVEAIGPVRETPLDVWIHRGWAGRITIKRLKGITPKQQKAVLKAAESYYGKPYDIYFSFENEAVYCSELAYNAFRKAGITLGEIQTLKDLYVENGEARKIIRERGMEHPLCADGRAATYNICIEKVMMAPLITPTSIAKDPKLKTIYTNYIAAKG